MCVCVCTSVCASASASVWVVHTRASLQVINRRVAASLSITDNRRRWADALLVDLLMWLALDVGYFRPKHTK